MGTGIDDDLTFIGALQPSTASRLSPLLPSRGGEGLRCLELGQRAVEATGATKLDDVQGS
jgi:hypothetical protein